MKKQQTQRSGVIRCQKCFKYGHYTYECQNQTAYRYRPSRTMQYKQKLKMQTKPSTKPPKVSIVNPDHKRRVIQDGPSSDSNQQQSNQPQQNPSLALKEGEKIKIQGNNPSIGQQKQQVNVEESQQQSSSDSSSDESSSSSDSSNSESQSKGAPRKKRPQQ